MIEADLTGANLHGAQLRNADLRAATFSFDLRFAALDADDTGQGVYMQSAGLDDVQTDEDTRLPPGIDETEVAKSAPPRAGEPPPTAQLVRVRTVTDGDTLRLDGKPSSLAGIDAPSLGAQQNDEPEQSQALLEGVVTSERVWVEKGFGKDDFGRQEVYVWADGRLVNQTMLAQGLAQFQPPSPLYRERLLRAEDEARDRGAGMWRNCPPP